MLIFLSLGITFLTIILVCSYHLYANSIFIYKNLIYGYYCCGTRHVSKDRESSPMACMNESISGLICEETLYIIESLNEKSIVKN